MFCNKIKKITCHCSFFIFFSVGQLNYEIALGVYAYLGNETEYVPWAAAVNNIGYLEGMFKRKAGYGALKVYKVATYTCESVEDLYRNGIAY